MDAELREHGLESIAPEPVSPPDSDPPAARFEACPVERGCPYCGSGERAAADRFDWSFLDGVYCISLQSRGDRARQATAELHRVGLCTRAVFYRPLLDRKPKRGCWESHRAVAAHARDRGLRHVLVLEDDVRFTRALAPATAAIARHALDGLPADWWAFYLGYWALSATRVAPHVVRCSALCTHAYIASDRLLDWLRDTPFAAGRHFARRRIGGKGIDAVFAALPRMYALHPIVAVQRFVPGDHMSAPRIRLRSLRSLAHDLLARSRVREWGLAHAMAANAGLVLRATAAAAACRGAAQRLRSSA